MTINSLTTEFGFARNRQSVSAPGGTVRFARPPAPAPEENRGRLPDGPVSADMPPASMDRQPHPTLDIW